MKKQLKIIAIILMLILAVTLIACSKNTTLNISETNGESAKKIVEYKIGDTGPAGGLIFYVNPDYITMGWRYLEAAPVNTEWRDIKWSNINWSTVTNKTAGAFNTAIGTGKANTATIISQPDPTNRAAQLCINLAQGGYRDWFLPSLDELNLMYVNLHLKGLGGFVSDGYWSSSEKNRINAWYQGFKYGIPLYDYKDYTIRVRAARAF